MILWQKSAITDSQATLIADISLPTFYQLARQRGLLGKQPNTKNTTTPKTNCEPSGNE